MRLIIRYLLTFELLTWFASAQQVTLVNDPVSTAVDHIYNLEYDKAINILNRFLKTNPDNLKALNRLADAMLRKETFRRGLMEVAVYGDQGDVYKPTKSAPDSSFDTDLTKLLDNAQGIADVRLAKAPEDVEALYWSGVTHGNRSIYFFTIKRSYATALRESKGAVKLHEKLMRLDPKEINALLTVGVNNYVVGSLPWYIKILAALGGAHGNKDEGLQQIRCVTQQGTEAKQDAKFILSLLDMREGNTAEALATLQSLAEQYPRNYLLLQEVAGVYRVRKEWNKALETYDTILSRHQADEPGFETIPKSRLLYLAGQTAASAGETDRALTYFQRGADFQAADVYRSRSCLAAANILQQKHQTEDAKRMYKIDTSTRVVPRRLLEGTGWVGYGHGRMHTKVARLVRKPQHHAAPVRLTVNGDYFALQRRVRQLLHRDDQRIHVYVEDSALMFGGHLLNLIGGLLSQVFYRTPHSTSIVS